jgi:hypothetical protein
VLVPELLKIPQSAGRTDPAWRHIFEIEARDSGQQQEELLRGPVARWHGGTLSSGYVKLVERGSQYKDHGRSSLLPKPPG